MSTPSPERLRVWRLFFESSLALTDLLDAELEDAVGIPMRWYDVLVHLEESPEGIPMKALAGRILYSKSGFTRAVDRMEDAGLVHRARPQNAGASCTASARRTTGGGFSSSSPTRAPRRWSAAADITARESRGTSRSTS